MAPPQKNEPQQNQPEKKTKQPQDPYAQRTKTLTSAVQRLRGWLGTDPAKLPELVDALGELTAHRLLGHRYADAATDAQDAVRRSAELMLAKGPIGPYTTVEDVARCGTALIHLAAVQIGLGLPESAGRTLDSWEQLQTQIEPLGLVPRLEPAVVIWAVSGSARVALAAGDVARADAYADAALARLEESGLRDDPDAGFLLLDVERVAADCRWAAGGPDESLGLLHGASERYDRLLAGRLSEPGRYGPVLLERLAEPYSGLHADLADRLTATGETDLGLSTRRALIETLRGLVPKLGDPMRAQLAAAWTDLAADLRAAGREDEAAESAAEATTASRGLPPATRRVRLPLGAEPGTATVAARSETADWLAAERSEAHRREAERLEQARRDADRRAADDQRAARVAAEREAADRARRQSEERRAAEERTAAEEAEQQERKRRRAERLREHRLAEIEERRAVLLAADRTEADEHELAQLAGEHAELLGAATEPSAEPEPAAEPLEMPEPPAEPVEAPAPAELVPPAEPVEAPAPAELVPPAEPEPAAEPLEMPEPPAEPVEAPAPAELVAPAEPVEAPMSPAPDELAAAQHAWRDARAQGDRKAVRAANERVVDLLRVRAGADLTAYGPQLQAALEDLASARLRGGDLFGSRAASKEAKAVGRSLGR